jgi:hypothetical protein
VNDDTKPSDAAVAKFRAALHEEILDGLKNEQDRRNENLRSVEYYNLRGTHLVPRRDAESDSSFQERPKRSLPITRRVVNVLCSKLYAPGPSRTIQDDDAASDWLNEVYQDNLINSLFQQADRMSTLNGIAAFQAAATGDPDKPIRYQLWTGWHEVIPFEMPGHANEVAAVVTIDACDNQTRYTLWTTDSIRTYETEKLKPGQTAKGRTARFLGEEPNPYGILPFAFVFYELPVAGVDSQSGLGPFLSELNGTIDIEMSDMAQAVCAYHTPTPVIIDGAVDWQPVKKIGSWLRVNSIPSDLDHSPTPKLEYLQANLDISGGWQNINDAIDRELEALGVPLTAYRMENAPHASGVALVAEQKPLMDYAVTRREPYRKYENDLKTVTLTVAGTYYGRADLLAAANSPMSLTWPAQNIDLPGPDQDTADGFAVAAGYESPVMVVQRRFGMTRDQAIAHLKQVAEDHVELAAIMQGVPGVSLAPPAPVPIDPNAPQAPIEPGASPPSGPSPPSALPPHRPFNGGQPFSPKQR